MLENSVGSSMDCSIWWWLSGFIRNIFTHIFSMVEFSGEMDENVIDRVALYLSYFYNGQFTSFGELKV